MISIVPNYLLPPIVQQIFSDLITSTDGNLSGLDKKWILDMSVQNVTVRATLKMDLPPQDNIMSMKDG